MTAQEQQQLRSLALFSGGAREDAVLAVGGSIDALPSLVDKALVAYEGAEGHKRYAVPGSIRTFAVERAKAMGEWRESSLRHARHYRDRARELETAYSTNRWRVTLEQMLPELDNLRSALLFTVTQGNDVQLGAELTCDLVNYWQQVGRNTDGREWVEKLLARSDVVFPKPVHAKLLCGLARLDTARSKRAQESALRAVELYRELQDDRGLAVALFEVAAAYAGGGDLDAADPYLDEALALAQRIGDVRRAADVLNGKALSENWRGRADRARELLELSLGLFRQLEDDRGVASLLGNLGDLAANQGQSDRAVSLSRQSWRFSSVFMTRSQPDGNC